MADDETIDLIFRVDTSVVVSAAQVIETLSARVDELSAENRDAAASEATFAAATAEATTKVVAAGEAIEQVTRQKRRFVQATEDANGSSKELNMSIINMTRAMQDLAAGGILGISNNIEQMGHAFGVLKTAGIGAATEALMGPLGLLVAIQALVSFGPKIYALIEPFLQSKEAVSSFAGQVARLREELGDLEKKKFKVDIDYQQIEQLKQQIKDLERARDEVVKALGAQARPEVESGRRIERAIAEVPGGQEALQEVVARRGVELYRPTVEALRTRLAGLREAIGEGVAGPAGKALEDAAKATEDELKAAEARLTEISRKGSAEAEAEIGRVLDQAKHGREQDQRVAQDRLAGMFLGLGTAAGDAMAKAVWNASAARVAQEEAEKQAKRTADEEKQKLAPLVADLAKGPLGAAFLRTGAVTAEQVQAELARTLPADTAQKLADPVFRAFQESMTAQIAQQATQGGVDEATARRQVLEREQARSPEARAAAEQVRRQRQEDERAQQALERQFEFLRPDIISSLQKGAAAGVTPAEAQQRVAEAVSAELRRRGLRDVEAEAAAFRLTLGAEAAAPAAAAREAQQAERRRQREAARAQAVMARGEARGFEQLIPGIERQLLAGQSAQAAQGQVEAMLRQAGAGAESSKAAHDLVARAATQLNQTYNRFFAETRNKDQAAFLTMQELIRNQLAAAANQQAMANGFRNLQQQNRAVQQQLQAVQKTFQQLGRP